MKKQLLLILVGFGLTVFSAGAQNPEKDSDQPTQKSRWDADTLTRQEQESLYREYGPNPNLEELGKAEKDSMHSKSYQRAHNNTDSVTKGGRSSIGPARSGTYDVDGKVNGELDANQHKNRVRPNTRNPK